MNHERGLFGKVGGVAVTPRRQRQAQAGRQQRDRPDRHDQPARCVRGRSQRPVHAADHGRVPERCDLSQQAERGEGKSLAAGNTRGGKGVFYTCNTGPLALTQIVQANLRQIGLDMDIRPFPRAVQFSKTGTRGEPSDLTLEGWHMDYFDPYDFLIFLLDGTTIRPANNVNFSYFNSRG